MDEENESGLPVWQKGLIAVLVLLLLGGLYLNFSGVSLRSLFGLGGAGAGEKVAVVQKLEGRLLRQPLDSLEFLEAPSQSDLFNEDTLMTGATDRATISLIDGSQIEMDPGSMIRLSFETSFSLGGIQRRVLVNVVSGDVRSNSSSEDAVKIVRKSSPTRPIPPPPPPPPSPSPSPSEAVAVLPPEEVPEPEPAPPVKPPFAGQGLRFASPLNLDRIAVQDGSLPPAQTEFRLASSVERDLDVVAVVRNSKGQQIFRKPIRIRRGSAGFSLQFDRPGEHNAEILTAEGKPFRPRKTVQFTVDPAFRAISGLPPLVGGQEATSNELRGKRLRDFSVQFRWRPLDVSGSGIETPDRYRLKILGPSGGVILDYEVRGTEFMIKKGRLSQNRMTYEINAALNSGYVATSGPLPFMFNFLSPKQTLPKNGQAVSSRIMGRKKGGGALFTWQKTSFTDSYEFEISADPGFSSVLKAIPVRENFVILKNLKPGEYHWRVRALGQGIKSPPNDPFRMTVTP